MLSEADIIATLRASMPQVEGLTGIGDDAAVLPAGGYDNFVVAKDILVEHRHFRRTTTDAASLAHKALHVNLSDIAAMGAVPQFVLLGLAVPPHIERKWIEEFVGGFAASCRAAKVLLIGGDTTASERDVFISVTIIGKASATNLKYRHTARAGDIVAVAGELGEAHAGFVALEKNADGFETVKKAHNHPNARTREGAWLGAQPAVTAMMDVSDGLYIDLTRLATASKCAAILHKEKLQPGYVVQEAADRLKFDAFDAVLTGGEDYALLVCVAADKFPALAAEYKNVFGASLRAVGEMAEGQGVSVRDQGKILSLQPKPFSHFGEL